MFLRIILTQLEISSGLAIIKENRMPKKTKKQKIIAQYRKKIKLLETQSVQPHPPTVKKTSVVKEQNPQVNTKVPATETFDKQAADRLAIFFVSDFKKSLLLTLAIITLEILFYFATIRNYLKL